MRGSVWERGDGRFGAEYPYKANGVTKKFTTKSTEGAAYAWLGEKEVDLADGLLVPDTHSLSSYLEEWLKDAVEPSVARRTYQKRAWAVNQHIVPAFGGTGLAELEPRAIQTLYASMSREGYAHQTRLAVHVTLKMALKQAVRWGLLKANPCEMVDAPRDTGTNHEEEEIRHLTDAQAQVLFAAAADCRWANFYPVAVRTGLRPGELLALRWRHIDLAGDPGSLRVRSTLDTHSAAVFGPPKTPAARRTVSLHFEAQEALAAQRKMLSGEQLPTDEGALVFPSEKETPMAADNLRKRVHARTLEKAGLPYVTLHELRHTFASIMLHEWMTPPAVVSKMMGHKSIAFTFDLYGHLIPSAQEDVMRRLNASQKKAKTG